MGLYRHYTVESETEIKTTPEKIWEFFDKMEDNYKIWHPECHHYWHWTKGKPLEKGSKIVSEEIIGGHRSKINATTVYQIIYLTKKHMDEEGANLKSLLEG